MFAKRSSFKILALRSYWYLSRASATGWNVVKRLVNCPTHYSANLFCTFWSLYLLHNKCLSGKWEKHRWAIRCKTPDQRIYCDIATESDNPDLAALASSDDGLLNQGLLWNKLLLRIHLGVLLALSSCSSPISTKKVTAFYINWHPPTLYKWKSH